MNYIITREQKRYIAKLNMKKDGQKHFCKHSYNGTKVPSYFALHWREYTEAK